jgi:carbamoyltransferase
VQSPQPKRNGSARRKHGKRPVPFSAWELPEQAIRWCLAEGGLTADDLDAVAYSYDPSLVDPSSGALDPSWEDLRTTYAARAPQFLRTALPGYDSKPLHFVRHHVAHAASAALAAPWGPDGSLADCAVLAVDGRGEATSMLAGEYRDHKLDILTAQSLPHSLGLLYEDPTAHLGFERSSDEYKVMAMASYGAPLHLDHFRQRVHATPDGGFRTEPVDWTKFAPGGPELCGQHKAARREPVQRDLGTAGGRRFRHRAGCRAHRGGGGR